MPDIRWPQSFNEMCASVREALSLDVSLDLGDFRCWVKTDRCAAPGVVPGTAVGTAPAVPLACRCSNVLSSMLLYVGFCLAMPLFLNVLAALRYDIRRRRALFDTSTRFYAIISLFLYPGLNNQLVSTILCESFDDLRVLRADRSLTCGEEPVCLATATIFMPLYTIGFPVGLLIWMRFGFTEAGRAQLLAWNKKYFVVAELDRDRGKHVLIKHRSKEKADNHLEAMKQMSEEPRVLKRR